MWATGVLALSCLAAVGLADPVTLEAGVRLQPPRFGENDVRNPSVPPGLCDNVHSLAGYFPIAHGKKYFYWIFESRHDWRKDPVVLWMTGGPGCSSEIALFHENGACIVNDDAKTTRPNPFGWNTKASVIYIDQPAGVGFSTGTANATNEDDVSRQMYEFLGHFFEANPLLANNDFWVFGESYGGHYVPAVGAKIQAENNKGTGKYINLKGIGIGNGLTDSAVQFAYYPEFAMHNPVRPLVNKLTYSLMKAMVPQCQSLIASCQTGSDDMCTRANTFCELALVSPPLMGNVNQYDIRKKCDVPPLCYDMSDVEQFLSQPEVRKALGVEMNVTWKACDDDVNKHFAKDWLVDFEGDVVELLAGGKHVLIYAGEDDFVCNYMGNKAWCLQMEWPSKDVWAAAPDRPWLLNGEQKGIVRSYGNLTFLQVHDAGHMVPMDQPEASLAMLDIFLYGDKFVS